MSFHLGKPILVMIIIGSLTALAALSRGPQRDADLTAWMFAESHYGASKQVVPIFEEETGMTVNLNLVVTRAMNLRLVSLFNTNPYSPNIPDLVKIEINAIGQYFRPPLEDVGFLPLNDRLKESGWYDRIVQQRFAPWSKEGVIFGVPHDVHPVTITYREDLYREAGIDLSSAKTWPEFHRLCEQFRDYWSETRGYRYRHAIELPAATADDLVTLLLQRGINLVDDHNQVHMNNPKVAHTVAFYAQMVAGPRRVAGESSGGNNGFERDITAGNLCAFISPDWRITYIKKYGQGASGKMRMMPLPKFDPDDAPTSTRGGTMIAITKACPRPDDAWKLIEKLYFSPEGLRARQARTAILPAVPELWDDPKYHEPDPYFGGQKADALFIELAHQIPRRYVTPMTAMATAHLAVVLNRARDHVERYGADGLEEACQVWLDDAAEDLKRRMEQWRFDP